MKPANSITVLLLAMTVFILILAGCGDTPETPKGLTVTSNNPITLSWSAVSNAKSYSVYRGTASGGLGSKTRIASDLTATTYTDNSAVGGTTYYYQVTAHNSDGSSNSSNEIQATASGGSFALVGTVSGTGISLTWATVSGAASYRVYRGMSATNLTLLPSSSTITSYLDSTVAAGTSYYYQIAAVNGSGVELQRSNITGGLMP